MDFNMVVIPEFCKKNHVSCTLREIFICALNMEEIMYSLALSPWFKNALLAFHRFMFCTFEYLHSLANFTSFVQYNMLWVLI